MADKRWVSEQEALHFFVAMHWLMGCKGGAGGGGGGGGAKYGG